uniref:Uncharacterized protein n=1 Tax=Oryza sativa subsp. japonica TaxID=39947 RepID=Q6Z7G6_ORYSJ|nr:hypothetical protein [Oryza sativa Japonica Group]
MGRAQRCQFYNGTNEMGRAQRCQFYNGTNDLASLVSVAKPACMPSLQPGVLQ